MKFESDVVGFTGLNGMGKTNILEAIHYLCLTKSFKTNKDIEVIQDYEKYYILEAEMESDEILQLRCAFQAEKGKKFWVKGTELEKLSHHIGTLPLVLIQPDDIQLIKEGGALRRKWIDGIISQFDSTYLAYLLRYEKIIIQRNAFLLLAQQNPSLDLIQLESWNNLLMEAGIYIQKQRILLFQSFEPIFKHQYFSIFNEKEIPNLRYTSSIKENTIENWNLSFQQNLKKDIFSGRTSAGIHRDEIEFLLNDKVLKNHGSQGQQKTFLLALKFAQYHEIKQKSKKAPILLLDDLFDKLDENRVKQLAEILTENLEGQVFITDTSQNRLKTAFPSKLQFFEVNHGIVNEL